MLIRKPQATTHLAVWALAATADSSRLGGRFGRDNHCILELRFGSCAKELVTKCLFPQFVKAFSAALEE
jgi:hypothetical protein